MFRHMTRQWRGLLASLTAIAAVALLIGCGGGGSSTDPATTVATSSVEASNAFLKPGSTTNELVEFGKEGSKAEREAASAVLSRNLQAREKADFATQCATLSAQAVESVAVGKKGAAADKACPAKLKALALPLSRTRPFRADPLAGEIDALRVQGVEAQALFHGSDGKDYAMPMSKEGVSWAVGSIMTTELNPPKQRKSSSSGPGK
jgi:hypothetical protein